MQDQDSDTVLGSAESYVLGYRVSYEQLASNWSAFTPELPTIIVTGETFESAERLIAEAITLHVESLLEDREKRPWLYTEDRLTPELRAVFACIDAA